MAGRPSRVTVRCPRSSSTPSGSRKTGSKSSLSPRRATIAHRTGRRADVVGGGWDTLGGGLGDDPDAYAFEEPSGSRPHRGDTEDEPHYLGHRNRLRQRFVETGGDSLPDYELLELVLFRSVPRR